MKQSLIIFFFIFSFVMFSQETKLKTEIGNVKLKVKNSKKGERLKWLDSLTKLTEYNSNFKYDSIVRETISYALQLDSINLATVQTANLIYYYNNIFRTPEKGLGLFKSFIDKKAKIKNENVLAQLYLNGADSYYFLNEFNVAITNYELARKYAEQAKDERLLALVNLYMGYAYTDMGNFSDASLKLQDAELLFQKVKDTFNIISAKNSLAILFSQNAFYEVAEQERNEAIVLAKKIKGYRNLTVLYANSAEDFRKIGKTKECISNLLLAIEANEKSNTDAYLRPILVCKLIVAYIEDGNLEGMEKYLLEIEKNKALYTSKDYNEDYLEVLKNIAFAKDDYQKSLKLAKEHLASKINRKKPEEIYIAEFFLSKVYKKLGKTAEAYFHLNNYYALKDSISSVQKINTLSYYQTVFEAKKRDFKIENQEKDITLLNEISKVKTQIMIFGGAGLISIFIFIILFRSRNNARREQKLQESFSQNLIAAQENERTRVARELHDSVGQKLMLLTKKSKMVKNSELVSLSENTLEELRTISRGLHPPVIEGLGITNAIISMINEVDSHTNIFFTNEIENIDNLLTTENTLHLYRIMQEVLSNIVKHANAKAAYITIEKREKEIVLIMKDNGKGFDLERSNSISLGMKILKERSKIIKSKLEISTQLKKGTIIQLIIPI